MTSSQFAITVISALGENVIFDTGQSPSLFVTPSPFRAIFIQIETFLYTDNFEAVERIEFESNKQSTMREKSLEQRKGYD